MGNTTTSSAKRDRTYSVDSAYDRRDSSSPRSDDSRTFEFVASSGSTASGASASGVSASSGVGGGAGGSSSSAGSGANAANQTRRKPVLCYQSSSEYADIDGPDEYKGRLRTRTISQGTSINENALPTVFKWEGGGKEVYITGTFSEWKPIKMCHSHGDFVAIIDVPEGTHQYKFVVDGQEILDSNVAHDEQNQNNVINVKKGDFEVFEALAMDLASNNNNNTNVTGVSGSPPGSYSQELPTSFRQMSESGNSQPIQHTGAGPPILPPHLLQVILNNPTVNFCEPTLLPQPNHVMLNHLYALSIKDGVMVLSATHRYRKKYVTTLLYKPI